MKARTYPVTRALWRALRTTALCLGSIFAFFLLVETARFAGLLNRLHPQAGWVFLGLLGVAAAVLAVRIGLKYARCRVLFPPPLPRPDRATFKEQKRFVQHLIVRLKRASTHPQLSPDQVRAVRQRAYDLESMLGAHPLLDDLRRAIARAEPEVWLPLVEHLDQDVIAFARYKMQAVVRDAIEPPFPIVHPALIFYHQATLICCIVDGYLARPSLCEYGAVIRDVWRVMVGGEYFRIGQRLFEGIYRNSPPLGPAAEDLGQALSVIWLTWTIAQAAMHRCRHYAAWSVEQAIAHLDHLTIDSLMVTRDTLIRDVLPLIKLRLRHSVGPAVADAAGFSEEVMDSIVKSVDGVVQSLRAQPPEQAAAQSRRTLHDLYQAPTIRPRRDEGGPPS